MSRGTAQKKLIQCYTFDTTRTNQTRFHRAVHVYIHWVSFPSSIQNLTLGPAYILAFLWI
jgi:hypothetical protein